jgi:hypothetical protein
MNRTIAVLALLVSLGCGRDESPSSAQDDAQSPEEAAAAASAAAEQPQSGMTGMPSQEQMAKMIAEQSAKGITSALGGSEWMDRELSMEDVRRFAQAARNLRELQATDPDLRARMSARQMGNQPDIQSAVLAEPRMREAIERAGMSVPEYIGTAGALAQSLMIAQMLKPNNPMKITEIPPGVSKANVEFVQKHEAEVTAALEGGQ